MTTAYITHPICRKHEMGAWHPESPARLAAIDEELHSEGLEQALLHLAAPLAGRADLLRVHDIHHVGFIERNAPEHGHVELDPDTAMNPDSLAAALRAAGAGILAVDKIMAGVVDNAFCAVRPPGHHAKRDRVMGFCLFNNIAIAAAYAFEAYGLARIAIVDFDVHHGNGTEDIFRDEPRLLLCSTFQHPLFPYCGADTVSDHIVNVPLPAGTDGAAYRAVFEARVLPALERFQPELILFSAGFDAHRDDPLAGLNLLEDDFSWITARVMDVAQRHAQGRMVSILEGGYNLKALGRSVAAHIRVLLGQSLSIRSPVDRGIRSC
jgi:acetoin utilization deacetylase AcuC-like enzyme